VKNRLKRQRKQQTLAAETPQIISAGNQASERQAENELMRAWHVNDVTDVSHYCLALQQLSLISCDVTTLRSLLTSLVGWKTNRTVSYIPHTYAETDMHKLLLTVSLDRKQSK